MVPLISYAIFFALSATNGTGAHHVCWCPLRIPGTLGTCGGPGAPCTHCIYDVLSSGHAWWSQALSVWLGCKEEQLLLYTAEPN